MRDTSVKPPHDGHMQGDRRSHKGARVPLERMRVCGGKDPEFTGVRKCQITPAPTRRKITKRSKFGDARLLPSAECVVEKAPEEDHAGLW